MSFIEANFQPIVITDTGVSGTNQNGHSRRTVCNVQMFDLFKCAQGSKSTSRKLRATIVLKKLLNVTNYDSQVKRTCSSCHVRLARAVLTRGRDGSELDNIGADSTHPKRAVICDWC